MKVHIERGIRTHAAKVFIQGGAQLQLKTYENDTPLDLAERYHYVQITETILKQQQIAQFD
ncbi:hypothetical protein [Pseudoalteromonas rubra]|uniref:Uncharacterized protein n=1 Tax=Pseudoalteromonas rubra TaxID=43658 RepID=A0A0U2X299_9GAMM|nr:hypothetical protein [Pseudoalteromonas rubra]ALU42404.1 hypothetical protein AT705_05230 [Pseudoalteromonas rubra]